jgi:ammonia channel protein AmtB
VYVALQATFAAITCCLILGSLVGRIKVSGHPAVPVDRGGRLAGFYLVDVIMGLRVPEEDEREGLDITSHGERGYDL